LWTIDGLTNETRWQLTIWQQCSSRLFNPLPFSSHHHSLSLSFSLSFYLYLQIQSIYILIHFTYAAAAATYAAAAASLAVNARDAPTGRNQIVQSTPTTSTA